MTHAVPTSICGKLLLIGGEEPGQPDALHEQAFEAWLRVVNWDDDPPAESNRYQLALPEGRAVYDFLVASGWKVRIVSLNSEDYEAIYEPWAREQGPVDTIRVRGRYSYKCVGTLER
jgi:hypothetical protein